MKELVRQKYPISDPRIQVHQYTGSLRRSVQTAAWSVRVYYKPFVDWIWGGCLVMALGGLLAASDRRYRAKVRRPAEATTSVASAA